MKPWCVTIQIKAIEKYFHVVLSTKRYKVVLTSKSVDEHSNESYCAVFSCGTVYCAVQELECNM